MARVVLERVFKIFQGRGDEKITALQDISLALEDKEMLVVVGPSGCGKTTLLRLIAGLDEPTSGQIKVDDLLFNGARPAERDIAMVFQHPALYPQMTAYENIAFGLKVRKCSRTETERRVTEAAELLGITDCLRRKPRALSGGQCQRVAVGRAIVRRPKLLLYDEPLANLDPPIRHQMRHEIFKLHQRLSITGIYVTHDQVEAMTLARRVAVLNRGMIHQLDEPVNLYRQPKDLFVAAFFGTPAMNLFNGTLVRDGERISFVMLDRANKPPCSPTALPLDDFSASGIGDFLNRQVILGIRPEDIAPCLLGEKSMVPFNHVLAVVTRSEYLGSETHMHLKANGYDFVARVEDPDVLQGAKKLQWKFNMAHAHFFDPSSGGRIGSNWAKEVSPCLRSSACAC
jgi:multiple sugar transport system ATP-binding protein